MLGWMPLVKSACKNSFSLIYKKFCDCGLFLKKIELSRSSKEEVNWTFFKKEKKREKGKNDVTWHGLARPIRNWTGWRVVRRQRQVGLVIKKKKKERQVGGPAVCRRSSGAADWDSVPSVQCVARTGRRRPERTARDEDG